MELALTSTEREKLIQQLIIILSHPYSPSEYYERIGNALSELKIPNEKFLQCCAKCLQRVNTNYKDTIIISAYLFRMPNFLKIFNDIEETQINHQISTVAKHLQYEKLDKNILMMKLGDLGKKAYILLSGNVDVVIKSSNKMKVAVKDYLLYIAKLLKFKEYGMINYVINDNFKIFPLIIDYDLYTPSTKYNDVSQSERIVSSTMKREKDKENEIAAYFKLSFANQSSVTQSDVKRYRASELLWLLNMNSKRQNNNNNNNNTNLSSSNNNNNNEDTNKEDNKRNETRQTTRRKEKEILYSTTTANYIDRIKIDLTITDDINNHKHKTFSPNNNEDSNTIVVNIYSYMKVASLTTGALFGEIALSNPLAQRTASIITTSNCHFGTLNKNSYHLSLKACKDKQIQMILKFIVSNQIFKGLNTLTLNKKYLNNFSTKRISKGEFILHQGDFPKSIYLLKEGEYEVTIKTNVNDLVEIIKNFYMKLPKTSKYVDILTQSQRVILNEIKENTQLHKIMYATHVIHLSTAECPNVVGLDDFVNSGKYAFSVECKSAKGEYMELKNVFYKDMRMKEYTIEENEIEFVEHKIKMMIDRMNNIRNSKLQAFLDSKKFAFDLGMEIESDIQRNNALKRKKDTQKTIINAKEIKLNTNTNSNSNYNTLQVCHSHNKSKSMFTPFMDEVSKSSSPQREHPTKNNSRNSYYPSPRKTTNYNIFNSTNNITTNNNNNNNLNGSASSKNYSLFRKGNSHQTPLLLKSASTHAHVNNNKANVNANANVDGSFISKDKTNTTNKDALVMRFKLRQHKNKSNIMNKSTKFWKNDPFSQALKLKQTHNINKQNKKDITTLQSLSMISKYSDKQPTYNELALENKTPNERFQLLENLSKGFHNYSNIKSSNSIKLGPIEPFRIPSTTNEMKHPKQPYTKRERNNSAFKLRQGKRTNTVSLGKLNTNPLSNVPESERAKYLQITINDIKSLFTNNHRRQIYN